MKNRRLKIEGFDEQEILLLSRKIEFQEIVFTGEPIIFSIGTSEILGQFKITGIEMEIVLSHITGGGEGVLIKLLNLFRKFGKEQKIEKINWVVHAVDCPKPNPKLPKILEKKGYKIENDSYSGMVYKKTEKL